MQPINCLGSPAAAQVSRPEKEIFLQAVEVRLQLRRRLGVEDAIQGEGVDFRVPCLLCLQLALGDLLRRHIGQGPGLR